MVVGGEEGEGIVPGEDAKASQGYLKDESLPGRETPPPWAEGGGLEQLFPIAGE